MSLVKINLQIDELKKILDELVVKEERQYKVALGKTVASALSGFLAGFIAGMFVLAVYAKIQEIKCMLGY
jgi:hypothetical protein